jgi:type I restriction enzyme, S subunit
MTDLPPGWAEARLADVAEVRLGRQRSPSRATGERMRPYLRAANVNWSGLALTDVKEMAFTEAESKVYELKPGDILLGEASGSPAEVGKPGQYKGEIAGCCFQNTLLRVRVPKELDSDFYELFFRKEALTGRFAAGSRGVGIHHLGAAALTNWTVPLPPRAEQERIVTAIEEAFSKLDAGEAALRATRQRLKRLRESVLAAAVTGRLVPPDPTDEPASKLLAAGGLKPSELMVPGELPSSWSWIGLRNISSDSGYGSSVKCDYVTDGPGVLRIPNVQGGSIDLSDLKRAPAIAIPEHLFLKAGDLLIVRTNGSRALIGRAAPVVREQGCSFASYLIRFRIVPSLASVEYLSILLSAPAWRRRLEAAAASSAGQYNLSLRTLDPLPIALPPRQEQDRIVAEVEQQFSLIEACDRTVGVGLARSGALRRSILKSAFEGNLVPQDPADEPAEALLKRIRTEHHAGGGAPSARRRSKIRQPEAGNLVKGD